MGTEISGGGGRGRLYLTLYCQHENDSCIKMGSSDSHFTVSLIVKGRVTNIVSINHTFLRERRVEVESNSGPSAYQPNTFHYQ